MSDEKTTAESEAPPEREPTIEEMAGQMLVAGFQGKALPGAIRELVAKRSLGGAILFSRNIANPAQARGLCDELRAAAPEEGPTPLVCVDQEGGRVARFGPPFTQLPPARALGACDDPGLAVKWGKVLAAELSQVGINLNLAPVLDVDCNPGNRVIGDRALSDRSETVARVGMAIALGMQQRGVGACAKHFPGHGDTTVDSHKDLPVLEVNAKRLKKVELLPFQRAAKGDMAAVMPGHLLVPAIDPDRPTSLSRLALKDLLRDEWGYDGIIITDDLEMGAIEGRYDMDQILDWGLEAEVDLFLFCHTPKKVAEAIDGILARVKEGKVEEARLRRSWDRIQAFKEAYPPSKTPLDPSVLGAPHHQNLVEAVLAGS